MTRTGGSGVRFVDLDTAAAVRAAAACRDAAHDARRVAMRLEPEWLGRAWEGAHAVEAERDLRTTQRALHAEARALEDTAAAIELGLVHARRLEERLVAEDAAHRAREQATVGATGATGTAEAGGDVAHPPLDVTRTDGRWRAS